MSHKKRRTRKRDTERKEGVGIGIGNITNRELPNLNMVLSDNSLSDDTPIEAVKGFGKIRSDKFRAMNIKTVGELRDHLDKQQKSETKPIKHTKEKGKSALEKLRKYSQEEHKKEEIIDKMYGIGFSKDMSESEREEWSQRAVTEDKKLVGKKILSGEIKHPKYTRENEKVTKTEPESELEISISKKEGDRFIISYKHEGSTNKAGLTYKGKEVTDLTINKIHTKDFNEFEVYRPTKKGESTIKRQLTTEGKEGDIYTIKSDGKLKNVAIVTKYNFKPYGGGFTSVIEEVKEFDTYNKAEKWTLKQMKMKENEVSIKDVTKEKIKGGISSKSDLSLDMNLKEEKEKTEESVKPKSKIDQELESELAERKKQWDKEVVIGELMETDLKSVESSYKELSELKLTLLAQFSQEELKDFFKTAKQLKAKNEKERVDRDKYIKELEDKANKVELEYTPKIKEYFETTKPLFIKDLDSPNTIYNIIKQEFPETKEVFNRWMIDQIYDEVLKAEKEESKQHEKVLQESLTLTDKDQKRKDVLWWQNQPAWNKNYNREAYRNLYKEYRYTRDLEKIGDKTLISQDAIKIVTGLNKKQDKIKTGELIVAEDGLLIPTKYLPEGSIVGLYDHKPSGRYVVKGYYIIRFNSLQQRELSAIFLEKDKVIALLKKED